MRLQLFAALLSRQRGEGFLKSREWSVYVERHIVGVRFMIRDAEGKEVDLQQVPFDTKSLFDLRAPRDAWDPDDVGAAVRADARALKEES